MWARFEPTWLTLALQSHINVCLSDIHYYSPALAVQQESISPTMKRAADDNAQTQIFANLKKEKEYMFLSFYS